MKQTLKDMLHHKTAPVTPITGTMPLQAGTATPLTGPLTTPLTTETAACLPAPMPGISERIEQPTVIHERVRREEVEEIQPVIHREHERVEVHQVTQPLYEGQIQPTQVVQAELPSETRATVTRGVYVPSMVPRSTTEFEGVQRVQVQMPPIIMETEKKRIIEEVQPVLYKEVVQPAVIRETKPIYEKIIEAPTIIKEVREPIHCHVSGTSFPMQTPLPATTNIPTPPPPPPVMQPTTSSLPFLEKKAPVLEKKVTVQQSHTEIPRI